MQQQISHIVFTVVTYLRVKDPWTLHLLLFLQFHQLYVGNKILAHAKQKLQRGCGYQILKLYSKAHAVFDIQK